MGVGGLISAKHHQHLALLNRAAGLHFDLLNGARMWRDNSGEHFHGFQRDDGLPLDHYFANADVNLLHRAGQRTDHVARTGRASG